VKTIDLKKKLKPFYTAKANSPCLIDVPAFGCLMVDGKGDPNSTTFQEAVGTLYAVAYGMKFAFKKEKAIDYPVGALEGLWDAKDITDFANEKRSAWEWTLLIVLPDVVTKKDVTLAVKAAREKAKFPRFPDVRFEKFSEGLCAQILHIGPYAEEAATIQTLHRFVADEGYSLRGRHHEIYLGDPRRAAPEKLRTILRHPVGRKRG
jgi:hypothetical protein